MATEQSAGDQPAAPASQGFAETLVPSEPSTQDHSGPLDATLVPESVAVAYARTPFESRVSISAPDCAGWEIPIATLSGKQKSASRATKAAAVLADGSNTKIVGPHEDCATPAMPFARTA